MREKIDLTMTVFFSFNNDSGNETKEIRLENEYRGIKFLLREKENVQRVTRQRPLDISEYQSVEVIRRESD